MPDIKTNKKITSIRVLASQGAINFDADTLEGEGIKGVIADVFAEHGLGKRENLAEDSVLLDQANEFVTALGMIFPNLRAVTISRAVSSSEGGGRHDWKTFERRAAGRWTVHSL